MPKRTFSKDEIISLRKDTMRDSGVLLKAAKAPPSWNGEKRTARFVMSTQARDRHGDVVMIEGIDLADFEKNPIALWSHAAGLPIGTWGDLEKNLTGRPKRLEGTLTFAPEETDETADRIARLTAAGIVRACSIGFMVDWDQVEPEYEGDNWMGFRFPKTFLVECSPCAVPANQQALAKAEGDDRKLAMEVVAEVLDNWTKTPAGVIVPRADYEAALKTLEGGRTVIAAKSVEPEPETVTLKLEVDTSKAQAEIEALADRAKEIEPGLVDRMVAAIKKAFAPQAEEAAAAVVAAEQAEIVKEEAAAPKPADPKMKALALARAAQVEAA